MGVDPRIFMVKVLGVFISMKLISIKKNLDVFRPIIYGVILFAISLMVFSVIFLLSYENFPLHYRSINDLSYSNAIIVSPIIETFIVMYIVVSAKDLSIKPIIYIPIFSFAAMLLHSIDRENLRFLIVQLILFQCFFTMRIQGWIFLLKKYVGLSLY